MRRQHKRSKTTMTYIPVEPPIVANAGDILRISCEGDDVHISVNHAQVRLIHDTEIVGLGLPVLTNTPR